MFAKQINIPPSLSLSTASSVKKLDGRNLRSPAAFALRVFRREESRTKEIYSLSIEEAFFSRPPRGAASEDEWRRKRIFLDLFVLPSSPRHVDYYAHTHSSSLLCASEHFVRHK